MNRNEAYPKAIERYITVRPRTAWPKELEERITFIHKNPLAIPDIKGMPSNCLPLFVHKHGGRYPYGGLKVYGMLIDTRLLEAYVHFHSQPYKVYATHTYPSLQAFFEELIHSVILLEIISMYKWEVANELRRRYPDIAPLFIDPPEIPPEVDKEYSYKMS